EVKESELAYVDLTVTPVNDAPVVEVGQTHFTGNEDVPLVIPGIAVSDVEADAEQAPVQVALKVDQGGLSFANTLPGGEISGSGTAQVTLVGTPSAINELLAQGVTFQPGMDFSGQVLLSVTVHDSTNPDASLSASEFVQITIQSTRQQVKDLRDQIGDLLE